MKKLTFEQVNGIYEMEYVEMACGFTIPTSWGDVIFRNVPGMPALAYRDKDQEGIELQENEVVVMASFDGQKTWVPRIMCTDHLPNYKPLEDFDEENIKDNFLEILRNR